jgi:hypothetical protein
MTAETPTARKTQQEMTVEEKISQLRELFADPAEWARSR